VDTDYRTGQPEIQILPDREAAARRGVSMSSIGNVISATMGGRVAGKFTDGGHRYDVRVRLKREQRLTAKDIQGLYVRNNRGELVRFSEVVRLEERSSLQSIQRINRERALSLYGNPGPGTSQQEALTEALKVCREVLPDGYRAELAGGAQGTQETMGALVFALLLGVVVAYMILGSQFNSFLHPVTVLLALPFSFSGAIAALLLTGQSLNMYSFIGLILLMGLVKKNSILLVDFTNQMRSHGKGVREALLEACPVRLRPILMTSISTIAAAIPAALALGPGAEVMRSMATSVIGGMLVSTVLTLVVVPCAYSLLSRLERRAPHSFETGETAG
jgi:HAE1 family hydrophobic/amphiphilic exporter-1